MSAPGRADVPVSGLSERALSLAWTLSLAALFWGLVGGFAYLFSLHGALPLRTDPLLGARQHLKRGNVPGAVDQFRIATQLYATDLRSLNELGELLLSYQRYDESASAFEQALALRPDSRARNGLGDVRYAQGRYADAAAEYERSLRLRPRQAGVLNDLGLARARHGDFDAAVLAFEASLALTPNQDTADSLAQARHDRARSMPVAR